MVFWHSAESLLPKLRSLDNSLRHYKVFNTRHENILYIKKKRVYCNATICD